MNKYAIIVAGGNGSRMKSETPKQFLHLCGIPVLIHTLRAFESAGRLEIILVLPEDQIPAWQEIASRHQYTFPHKIVSGGETRFHSVRNGLEEIPDDESLIAVHDGVRPLISPALINRCYEDAEHFGSAITAVHLKDSIVKTEADLPPRQQDRGSFRLVQTPQVFRADWMKKAFKNPHQPSFTDCASVVAYAGYSIHLTEGDYRNLKITTPEDLLIAEALFVGGTQR